MDPYRVAADVEPPEPVGCPCGCSVEVRIALNAVGGWWHTPECDRWRAWQRRNKSRTVAGR